MSGVIEQLPTEVLDWTIDWTLRGLGAGDTVNTSNWVVTSTDVTLSGGSINAPTNTKTTIFVTGGQSGLIYYITNTIVTVGGRTMVETIPYICLAKRMI